MIDLFWMGLLMAVMVAETTLPFGARLTRPLGIALLAAGGWSCLSRTLIRDRKLSIDRRHTRIMR